MAPSVRISSATFALCRIEGQRKEMVGDVAHELRTPLSKIRDWLEAIEDAVVAPDRALTSSLLEEVLLLNM